jgi:D-alanyl-D-alanine carboxypeptidase
LRLIFLSSTLRRGYNRVFAVSDGIALGHGCLLYAGGGKKTPGLRTLIMKFPNKVELALAINSTDEGAKRNINTIVQTAYNNAWVND